MMPMKGLAPPRVPRGSQGGSSGARIHQGQREDIALAPTWSEAAPSRLAGLIAILSGPPDGHPEAAVGASLAEYPTKTESLRGKCYR